ncbi:hypothetical protein PHSY_004315 [Pseudozyma hubeiensis SY62]|uniref:Uncharacterized protein n=1 Tax=Pseudozyma hubeiensis (strain SY62) TaxID=1305764 RepID=R9P5V6_PSEHS|nr:hypothetical protein PHSY_004315 [Pseudozyma hubeiensis SY62]GAC96731.1 hypothetical protein PHSY_004315 [Pseudozyma hubeiensis SY62]
MENRSPWRWDGDCWIDWFAFRRSTESKFNSCTTGNTERDTRSCATKGAKCQKAAVLLLHELQIQAKHANPEPSKSFLPSSALARILDQAVHVNNKESTIRLSAPLDLIDKLEQRYTELATRRTSADLGCQREFQSRQ